MSLRNCADSLGSKKTILKHLRNLAYRPFEEFSISLFFEFTVNVNINNVNNFNIIYHFFIYIYFRLKLNLQSQFLAIEKWILERNF